MLVHVDVGHDTSSHDGAQGASNVVGLQHVAAHPFHVHSAGPVVVQRGDELTDRAVQESWSPPEGGRCGQVHRLGGHQGLHGEQLPQPDEHRRQPPCPERRVGRVVLDGVRAVPGVGAHRCGQHADLGDERLRRLGQRGETRALRTVRREVRGQSADGRVEQPPHAFGGDRRGLRQGQREGVEGEGQGRGVEIAGREDLAGVGQHHRVVAAAVELRFQRGDGEVQRGVQCAVHLGRAAQADRVLDPPRVPGIAQLAAVQQGEQLVRRPGLPRRRTQAPAPGCPAGWCSPGNPRRSAR